MREIAMLVIAQFVGGLIAVVFANFVRAVYIRWRDDMWWY
jgi:hypothetical protein